MTTEQDDDASSLDSDLEWELDEGIPQVSDPFIQKYLSGREALIAQEKKQRHDHTFKTTMTPLAKQAAKIMSSIRKRELRDVWTSEYEESLADKNNGNLYPGMMFSLARDRIEKTEIWKIIEKMPKGSLLHAHLDAMIDVDWLIDETLAEKGMCILAPAGLSTRSERETNPLEIRYFSDEEISSKRSPSIPGTTSIWAANYSPYTPIPIKEAARMFPDDTTTFKKWLFSRCTISAAESLNHHHGLDAIWRRFQTCLPLVDWMLMYEPIFRRALFRLFTQLAADHITYVELRTAFMFEYRAAAESHGRDNHALFCKHFSEVLASFKASPEGKSFTDCRIIWTAIRRHSNRQIAASMKSCIAVKKLYPSLISGFDFVAQEDLGRPLTSLVPLIFWFRKQALLSGLSSPETSLPFFFHAGECLGDGDATDQNLFDAVLLGTRRIGHGYSLYKHPLLVSMVKDKKILIESCPISNEVLRLTQSIQAHTLPALLSRGVACSLNNDDPAVLGHGKNGLSHDFWQSFMGWENLGLSGLGQMAENSVRWSCVEDVGGKEWLSGLEQGYMGKGKKARMLRGWREAWERWCQWVCEEYPLEGWDDEDEDGMEDEEDEGEEEEDDEDDEEEEGDEDDDDDNDLDDDDDEDGEEDKHRP